MTPEERESIISEAVERALLQLPDVVANLIASHVSILRINKEFYGKHPEMAGDKDIVAAVVEMVEGENPGLDYRQILDRAIPIIEDRIKNVRSANMQLVKPSRNLNGEL